MGEEKGGSLIRYVNAEEILPESLVDEIRRYYPGGALYIPSKDARAAWGEQSGTRAELAERNARIRREYDRGEGVERIAERYCLSADSIRKIVKKTGKGL